MTYKAAVAMLLCCAAALLSGCKPTLSFAASNTEGAPPFTVTFTGECSTKVLGFIDFSAIFPIKEQTWDFGDSGDISEDLIAKHTYTDVGKYTVSFSARNLFGTSTLTRNDLITVTGTAPAASFQVANGTGKAPLTVTFTDTSTAGSKPITAWVWDFGDGTTAATQNATHTFSPDLAAGESQQYTVRLTASNAVGESTYAAATPITVTVEGPTADFVAAKTEIAAPGAIKFTDNSLPGSYSIEKWEWNFGDGGASADKNPTHTYEVAGKYTVALTVTTSAGTSAKTKTDYISIFDDGPIAKFNVVDNAGLAPFDAAFKDLSVPGRAEIDSYAWDFGDGGKSTAQHPHHTYSVPGVYTVSLTVKTNAGENTATKTDFITVYGQPAASFTSALSATVARQAAFTDTSDLGGGTLVSYAWDFGDGDTHTIQNPVHTYAAPGTYTVKLTVTVNVGEKENQVVTAQHDIVIP